MKRVVMFSGGAGSWAAARRVANIHGTDEMVLLFADVLIEDPDLYRFLEEAAANLGVPVTRIAEGRTPLQVMRDVRYIGNTRVDPCSLHLKRNLMTKWRDDHCDPRTDVVYVGIDFTEEHRVRRMRKYTADWRYEAPLCDAPYIGKTQVLEQLTDAGLTPPRLYGLGFAHNNCGGACIKGGQAQWARLYQVFPERYAMWETWEEEMRELVGDRAILRDRRDGTTTPYPLKVFREHLESGGGFDKFAIGGCGCAL